MASENENRVVKILADEIKKINERYPHFDVIITDDYISRPVVNEIVKDSNIKYSPSSLCVCVCVWGGGGGWSYIRGGLLLEEIR